MFFFCFCEFFRIKKKEEEEDFDHHSKYYILKKKKNKKRRGMIINTQIYCSFEEEGICTMRTLSSLAAIHRDKEQKKREEIKKQKRIQASLAAWKRSV